MLGKKADKRRTAPNDEWAGFRQSRTCCPISPTSISSRAPSRRRDGPKRFDTRFFTADAQAIGHRIEGVVGADSELVELVWIPIKEAKTLDMPTITATSWRSSKCA